MLMIVGRIKIRFISRKYLYRSQSKRVNIGNRIPICVSKPVERNRIGNSTGNNIRIDKPSHIRRVIARSHIDKPVFIRHNAVSAVVAEDHLAGTGSADELSVRIVCKGVDNGAARIGDGDGAATAVEVDSCYQYNTLLQ